jgi:hypothetical protein
MNLLKRYRIIIFITLPLLILLAVRVYTPGSFKYDAQKWAQPSFGGANIIAPAEIERLPGQKLIVYLDKSFTGMKEKYGEEVEISPDSVLERKFFDKIREHKGPVLFASSDPALSARIWMLISQTGCKNLFILSGSNDNEAFKSEFRSDTMARPEL